MRLDRLDEDFGSNWSMARRHIGDVSKLPELPPDIQPAQKAGNYMEIAVPKLFGCVGICLHGTDSVYLYVFVVFLI